jgi:hypothetical protein
VNLLRRILWVFSLALMQGQTQLAAADQEFPFQIREGLIWLNISVPQASEPLNVILDSGAEVSTVDFRVVQRLGLKWGRPVSVLGVKSSVTGYWPEHLFARLGEVVLPQDFLAVDLSQLNKACGGGMDGILGEDFFKGRRLQIDFKLHKIRLLTSVVSGGNEESLPIQVRSSGILVKIRVNNGKEQNVRLDTGCASPLQWVRSKEVSIPLIRTSVRIGATEFDSVQTGLQDHQIFPGEAGLLGTALLSRFAVVTVDTVAKRLFLKKE